jgi:serine/threonine protein kinase
MLIMDIYPPGSLIADQYEVASLPKMGGMGIVYFCLDKKQNPVALKTFRPEFLPDRKARDQFLQEGATWLDIGENPHIVHCHQIILTPIVLEPFFVLELVTPAPDRRDASLRSWLLPGQPLSMQNAVAFAIQIARGMKHAVTKIPGLVHRDLKPENILVGADKFSDGKENRVRVTDFGLATFVEKLGLTPKSPSEGIDNDNPKRVPNKTHRMAGTPQYMAPEQWRGEELGIFTDVYALGCILFEMLTGKPAVEGYTLSELQSKHCEGRLRDLPSDFPSLIRDFIVNCTGLKSGSRYTDWDMPHAALIKIYDNLSGKSAPQTHQETISSRDERIAVGWSHANIGSSYQSISRHDIARKHFELALQIGQREDEHVLQCFTYHSIGLNYFNMGEIQHAISCLDKSLSMAQDNKDRRMETVVLGTFGVIYRNIGKVKDAITLFEKALGIAKESMDLESVGKLLGNLGNAYLNLGDIRRAIEYYEPRLTIAKEMNDRLSEATVLGNLGNAYADLGDKNHAVACYQQQLDIAQEIGDRDGQARALSNMGIIFIEIGYIDKGAELLEQGLLAARETNNRRQELTATGNLANAYYTLGEPQRAIEFFNQAIQIAREIGDLEMEARSNFNLASLLIQEHNETRALSLLKIAMELFTRIGLEEYANTARQWFTKIAQNAASVEGADYIEHQIDGALEGFLMARTEDELRIVVRQYRFMTSTQFISTLDSLIAKVTRSNDRFLFDIRLRWLKQIAKEDEL